MIKTLNDIYRDKLGTFENDSDAFHYIAKLDDKEIIYVLKLLAIDLYKMLSFTDNNLYNNQKISDIYENYVGYILYQLMHSKEILSAAIAASKEFNGLDLISKSCMLDFIEQGNKDLFLINVTKAHLLDKMVYKFSYELDYFKEFYKSFTANHKTIEDIKYSLAFFVSKLNDLKVLNDQKYFGFIREFLRTYYKFELFNQNRKDKPRVIRPSYLKYIENNPMSSLLNRADNDLDFLFAIIHKYLEFYKLKDNTRDNIDEYYYFNTDKEIQKKLKK